MRSSCSHTALGVLIRRCFGPYGLVDVPLAVDVGVVHTLQSSIPPANMNPGQHAKKMEGRKSLERQALCPAADGRSHPL